MIEYFLPAASTYAADIDLLFSVIFWLVGFWFVLSEGAFFYLIFRFRKKEGVPAAYLTGDEKDIKRWLNTAHALILICDVVIVIGAVRVWYDVKQHLPEADQVVEIMAQQWAWSFRHPGPDGAFDTPDDIRTVDELHLQVDTVYHYKLEARDVLHNFSVPVFRLKQDAVPGRVITGWFEPTMTGSFDIQCAEICGIGHGLMAARLVVESATDHAAWIAAQSPVHVASAATQQSFED
jgi:cytochrome c oxidase subunit 2